jgi:hypothetical protein
MSVVDVFEVPDGRSVSGKFRETFTYTRSFLVRVTAPSVDTNEIIHAAGIGFLDPHPDNPDCIAQEFDCQAADESGLHYRLTVRYYVPTVEQQNTPQSPGSISFPGDVWSASASITTGPCLRTVDGQPILNSARDPIPGLEQEYSEYRLTLTRCFRDLSWTNLAGTHCNAVNSEPWMGHGPRTWKVAFQSATKMVENNDGRTLVYWSTVWDFAFRRATWDKEYPDVGLQEIRDGKKQVIKVNGEPVVQPVALSSLGLALPEDEPTMKKARVYDEVSFAVFGVLS